MRHMQDGYRGLSVLLRVNADRLLSATTILGAILLAIWVQSL